MEEAKAEGYVYPTKLAMPENTVKYKLTTDDFKQAIPSYDEEVLRVKALQQKHTPSVLDSKSWIISIHESSLQDSHLTTILDMIKPLTPPLRALCLILLPEHNKCRVVHHKEEKNSLLFYKVSESQFDNVLQERNHHNRRKFYVKKDPNGGGTGLHTEMISCLVKHCLKKPNDAKEEQKKETETNDVDIEMCLGSKSNNRNINLMFSLRDADSVIDNRSSRLSMADITDSTNNYNHNNNNHNNNNAFGGVLMANDALNNISGSSIIDNRDITNVNNGDIACAVTHTNTNNINMDEDTEDESTQSSEDTDSHMKDRTKTKTVMRLLGPRGKYYYVSVKQPLLSKIVRGEIKMLPHAFACLTS
eukprot:312565_1